MKKSARSQLALHVVFMILTVVIILPFIMVLSVSFSSEKDIMEQGYKLFPSSIDFSAYEFVFTNPKAVSNAYQVTFLFSVIGTFLGVLLMGMLAFGLSKRELRGKNQISFYLYFTMLFSGGLVPSYILITQYLKLQDTIWVYIIPGLINPWYVFMMRTFFQGIAYEITEASIVDGASEYTIFFKIIMPLSKPVFASVALFVFLGKWNDWYTSMLYINDSSLVSLQYLLQRIMKNVELLQLESNNINMLMESAKIPTETARMAMAVVVAGPALLIYPFFQKYFVRGLTIGGVKG